MNLRWGCGDTKGKPVNCAAGFAPAAEDLVSYRRLGQALCAAVSPRSLSTSIPGDQASRGLEGLAFLTPLMMPVPRGRCTEY